MSIAVTIQLCNERLPHQKKTIYFENYKSFIQVCASLRTYFNFCFLLKSEWLQVFIGLQDFTEYSRAGSV